MKVPSTVPSRSYVVFGGANWRHIVLHLPTNKRGSCGYLGFPSGGYAPVCDMVGLEHRIVTTIFKCCHHYRLSTIILAITIIITNTTTPLSSNSSRATQYFNKIQKNSNSERDFDCFNKSTFRLILMMTTIYSKRRFIKTIKMLFGVEALSHSAIFLATCNAILLLRDVNLCQMFCMLKINWQTVMETCICQFYISSE